MTGHTERLDWQLRAMQTNLLAQILRGAGQDELKLIDSAVLSALAGDQSLTLKELADIIARSVSRTSRLIDRLVTRGLVERTEHPTDRRAKILSLSQAGEAFLNRIRAARTEQIAQIIATMSPAEQEHVLEAFDLLGEATRRFHNDYRSRWP